MTSITEAHFPKNLYEIIEEVYAIYKKNEENTYFNILLQVDMELFIIQNQ